MMKTNSILAGMALYFLLTSTPEAAAGQAQLRLTSGIGCEGQPLGMFGEHWIGDSHVIGAGAYLGAAFEWGFWDFLGLGIEGRIEEQYGSINPAGADNTLVGFSTQPELALYLYWQVRFWGRNRIRVSPSITGGLIFSKWGLFDSGRITLSFSYERFLSKNFAFGTSLDVGMSSIKDLHGYGDSEGWASPGEYLMFNLFFRYDIPL